MSEPDLRALLLMLDPKARDDLRRVLIRDQADRDTISSRLMRHHDPNGQDWADIIDFLTMYPDARRRVARVLAEIECEVRGRLPDCRAWRTRATQRIGPAPGAPWG